MTKEEQERKGKEIVEKLNKGKEISGFNISDLDNIKQLYFIKIEEIDSNKFILIALPIDKDGEWLLEMKFLIKIVDDSIVAIDGAYFNNRLNKPCCFTKFKLTGNFWEEDNLDYWLVRDERFECILKYLKEDDPEYNLAMYELFGFNEEYIRKNFEK